MPQFKDMMISAKNFSALTQFYKDFAGLETLDARADDFVLLLDSATGQTLCITNGPSVTNPAPSLEVESISTALELLAKLGGSVVRTWEYAGMKGANVKDPEGNEILIFQGSHQIAKNNQTFASAEKDIRQQEARVRSEMARLLELHRTRPAQAVQNYTFKTLSESVTLSSLFGDKSELILIHNMGKRCPYCTLWADGFNGFTAHLENRAGFVLVNNDSPEVQREFAQSRGWRFNTVSAEGTPFAEDMGFADTRDCTLAPGVSIFKKLPDGAIVRTSSAGFGPGDVFCSIWSLFGMLPSDMESTWAPKYHY